MCVYYVERTDELGFDFGSSVGVFFNLSVIFDL